jgi:hypothetical protein
VDVLGDCSTIIHGVGGKGMNTSQPKCPECEKLAGVAEESNKIGDFLDWMIDNTSFRVCEYDSNEYFSSSHFQRELLLAQYFDIDLKKVEQERRSLLKWLRSQHRKKQYLLQEK